MFGKQRNQHLTEEETAHRRAVLSARLQQLATAAERVPDAKRIQPRKRALHLALVRLSSDCAVSCTVRDITDSGFRLEFIEEVDLPKICKIEIPVLGEKYHIAIRWKHKNIAGVEIVDADDSEFAV